MPRVLLTRPIPPDGHARLAAGGVEVVTLASAGGPFDEAALRRELPRAQVVLPLLTERIGGELLAAAPGLLGVANMAVGYDNVDVAAATKLGIPVANTPGILTDTTADLTWALLLGAARHVVAADAYLRAGRFERWGPELFLGEDPSPGGDGRPKVLGVVGFGRIGAAVARRAGGFAMEVIAHDPRHPDRVRAAGAEPVDLGELLDRADFVSLHLPLRPETRHLIGAPELRRMKPTAVLVNTARGPLVDEAALVVALREGWIAAAGLDVFEDEPALAPGLVELPNTVLLPHVGSASRATRNAMAERAAINALAMAAGERAPDCVNPQVYESEEWEARKRMAAGA